MLLLPIPLVVALVLAFLCLRSRLAGDWPVLISALLFFCALQGVVISLSQYYGVVALLPLQPVTATIVPPLAWVAFRTSTTRRFSPRADPLHLAAPAFTAFCVVFAPVTLDIVVPGIFALYGAAILAALRHGGDGLPLARLESGSLPAMIWRALAAMLILSAVSDGLIGLSVLMGRASLQPWIVSVGTSFVLLSIGLLCLSPNMFGEAEAAGPEPVAANQADGAYDADLMGRLEQLIRDEQLYLDPNLTLARLARRLHVPIKQLSAAINRSTGENVSRYINNFRIRRACERLRDGDNVTTAMLESGFNTKSNFNREFTRVTGMAPSAWSGREGA